MFPYGESYSPFVHRGMPHLKTILLFLILTQYNGNKGSFLIVDVASDFFKKTTKDRK